MNISKPTKDQLTHGLERVLGVFLVACAAYLHSHTSFDQTTLRAAYIAGVTAVYQLAISTLTNH